MKANDFMTKNVITCRQDQTLDECANLMTDKNLSAMPITNEKNDLVGIITVSDFIGKKVSIPHVLAPVKQIFHRNFSCGDIEEIYNSSRNLKLEKVMTKRLQTVTPNTKLTDIVNIMLENKLKRLPVVSGTELVGIITRKDIVKAFSHTKKSPVISEILDANL